MLIIYIIITAMFIIGAVGYRELLTWNNAFKKHVDNVQIAIADHEMQRRTDFVKFQRITEEVKKEQEELAEIVKESVARDRQDAGALLMKINNVSTNLSYTKERLTGECEKIEARLNSHDFDISNLLCANSIQSGAIAELQQFRRRVIKAWGKK